ncbi:hypothetical protein MTP99_011895 [Tenebrio molitor]|nr:hypothetical protein MTP99_011895 [Tenebrio molitor]
MRRCDGGPPIAIPFPGRVGWKKSKENDNYGAPIKNVDIIWSLFEVSIGTPNSAIIIVNKFITKHSIFSIIPSNRVYGNPNRRLLSALGDDRDNVTMKWAVLKREFPDVMSRVHHFSASLVPGTVVFCGGGEAAAVRAIGDHFRLVLHRFCSNNPAHNSSIDRKLRRSTPPLLKFEIRDAHLTDYNSTLTDKDCRVAAAGPPEPAAFCAFFADGWNKLLFERSTRALPTVSV